MKIAVVGGGIGGLVSTWLALEAGHEVSLFEQGTLGSGASGKALGVLVPVTGMDRPVDRLQREGIAAWPDLAQRLAYASGEQVSAFWRDWGDGRQQVRLPKLFEVLKAAITARGGEVKENAKIESPALLAAQYDRVVLAAGLGNVALCGADVTVSAGVAAKLEGRLDRLVAGDNLFACPDWDDSVIVGSVNWGLPVAGDGTVPSDKLQELLERIGRIVPELNGARVIESWVGYRPLQAPRLPLIKPVHGNVMAITGLGKVGIGISPVLKIWE